ncbi:hypothetical protein Pan258_27980 [Symmachiella dynata]|uniref:hypothetical protein n=1 Tax=Symmachiella dynata TaxID=2527995 RepID=UPI001188141F|nr:hypothetical protein [Symmachiella dynata]QDT48753.1 hypothetical protein Pan258_27980 [Symmachiella dynata]
MCIPKEDLARRIQSFKSDLAILNAVDMARRHVVFGECAAIDAEEYFRLRTLVAGKFEVHPNDVLIVGSGKLGFSIAPSKRYQPFGDSSDLDVVIISERFFDLAWTDVHRYFSHGGYWEQSDKFRDYLFSGWFRPDKLPPDQKFPFGKEWWEFFNEISASREFSTSRIRGAIYKNWYFLEAYQQKAIDGCARALELNEEDVDED